MSFVVYARRLEHQAHKTFNDLGGEQRTPEVGQYLLRPCYRDDHGRLAFKLRAGAVQKRVGKLFVMHELPRFSRSVHHRSPPVFALLEGLYLAKVFLATFLKRSGISIAEARVVFERPLIARIVSGLVVVRVLGFE
jgi:hypothetical protein